MPLFFSVRKAFALLLVTVLLTVRLGHFSHEAFVEPIQSFIAKTAFFSSDDVKQKSTLFKPKRPAEPLVSLETCALPAYLPWCSRLVPFHPFRPLPEVFPDIFVPPESPCRTV